MVYLSCEYWDNGTSGYDDMSWTRRIFVRETLKGWLGLVIAPAAYARARALVESRGSEPAQPRDIGAADALLAGTSKTVQYSNKRVLVARDRNGQVFGVSAICTHMGCSVRFEPDRGSGVLACNCHESRFTLRGENLGGPAIWPLEEYHVEAVGGRLIMSEKPEIRKVL